MSMFSRLPWASSHDENSPTQAQHAQNPPPDEQSLTTILSTVEDRTNLLLLIANTTDTLRQNLLDNFDPEKTNRAPKLPPRPTSSDAVEEKTTEELQPEQQEAEDREKTEYERRVQELASSRMQDLKTAALTYYDEWRDRVFERIGEAINERPAAGSIKQENRSSSSQVSAEQSHSGPKSHDKPTPDKPHEEQKNNSTPLTSLSEPKRILILHSLLLLLLSLERYPSESRQLLLHLTSVLHLPLNILTTDESKVARGLIESAAAMSADEETKKKVDEGAISRKWKVGLGAVAGAALIGVTGGLAAPLLAAGVGTVMGGLGLGATAAAGYLGALAGSAPLVGVLFGAYGGRMTGRVVDEYAKEVSDFAFIPIRKSGLMSKVPGQGAADEKDARRLRVTIGISGWLTGQHDIVHPWRVLSSAGTEAFALRWEMEALINLGNALGTYVKSAAWGLAKREIISRTIFGALSAGLWPLGLAKVSRVIDNPFSVAKSRSDKAGVVLADALINKVQGERPVTLVGYSLGARVVYSCLQSLSERKAFGLVENVVLLGTAAPSDSVNWRRMKSVVSGRVINVYSTNDYLLGFLYRTSSLQYGIAGLQPVEGVVGVENVDVSGMVDGHMKYRLLTGRILEMIGMEDVDVGESERLEKEEKKEEERAEEERKKRVEAGEEADPEQMEKEIEEKNKSSMMGWVTNKVSSLRVGTKEQYLSEDEKFRKEHDYYAGMDSGSDASKSKQGDLI